MNQRSCISTWLTKLIAITLIAQVCVSANAAGIARVTIPASGTEPALQVMVWTPCAKASGTIQIGIFALEGITNCEVAGDALPLIVISHGKGGSLVGHHDTASALADAGFVVAALSHPGDSFGDDSATESLTIFESRPRDIGRLISFMTENWQHRQHLNARAIGVFGFSRGGYTALSLIGAVPNISASAQRFCGSWWSFAMSMCRQLKADGAKIRPLSDPRVRAAVVVDPLNLFSASSFKAIRVPVQLWASELGGDGVELSHIQAIKEQLPKMPEFHVAEGAGHFAYLAPCPPALMQSAKEICSDPQGFDRLAWHKKMNADVVSFFRKNVSLLDNAVGK